MRLAELVGTLSLATDAGTGMPDFHALRGATLAARFAERLGADDRTVAGMLRGMLIPDAVYVFKDARKVGDAAVVDACWRQVLAWPAKTVITYHDPAGHGFHGDGWAALEVAARERRQILAPPPPWLPRGRAALPDRIRNS